VSEALSRRYLSSALSTITKSALPDVRDGMKPVHRPAALRHAPFRLDPETTAKKCARVVAM